MLNESDYIVSNKLQVASHLANLHKKKCLFSLSFDRNKSFLTMLAGVDTQKNLLYFDCAPSEELNEAVLTASEMELISNFSGIKVHFQSKSIKKERLNGENVLSMPMPQSIYWVQRRNYYRVKLPLLGSTLVKIIVDNEFVADLPLYDISITGFSFLAESGEMAKTFAIGKRFTGCHMVLENDFNGEIAFEVVNVFPLDLSKPDSVMKIGCKYSALKRSDESAIQLYMHAQERKDIIKKGE